LQIKSCEFNTSHLTSGNSAIEAIAADKAPNGNAAAFSSQMAMENSVVTSTSNPNVTGAFLWTYANAKNAFSN
jgi:hypothetical protein